MSTIWGGFCFILHWCTFIFPSFTCSSWQAGPRRHSTLAGVTQIGFAGCHQACSSQPSPLQWGLMDKSTEDRCPWPPEGVLHLCAVSWGPGQWRILGGCTRQWGEMLHCPLLGMPQQPARLAHVPVSSLALLILHDGKSESVSSPFWWDALGQCQMLTQLCSQDEHKQITYRNHHKVCVVAAEKHLCK